MTFDYFKLYSLRFTVRGELRLMYAHNFSEKVSLRSLEQHSPPARIDSSQRVFFLLLLLLLLDFPYFVFLSA